MTNALDGCDAWLYASAVPAGRVANATRACDERGDRDEALDGLRAGPGAFTVTVAGAARGLDPVAVSGKTVTLTLASAVAHGEAVTLAYTVPAVRPLRNLAELEAAGFAGRANATPDATAPVLHTASVNGAVRNAAASDPKRRLAYVAPAAGAQPGRTGGAGREVANGDRGGDGKPGRERRTLTLASAVAHGEAVTLAYTVPAGAGAQPLQPGRTGGGRVRRARGGERDAGRDGAGAAHWWTAPPWH